MNTITETTRKLKAYRVDNPYSHSTLVYAETAGQARMIDFRAFHDGDFDDVLAMRVTRVPLCDGYAFDLATYAPAIDDDPWHQLRAGMLVECQRCGREMRSEDDAAWGVTIPMMLCRDCAAVL